MIDRISIANFQSHPETVLELVPGINTIIGSSDSGKSAIFRAILWVVENRPTGSAFVSSWSLDEKGKMKSATGVTIGRGEEHVSRLRNSNLDSHVNCYELNGTPLEAMKTAVPEPIAKWLNLAPVNVQKQLDAPFLLSASAGEVARFFNSVVNLDDIDRALSLVDKKRRENDRLLRSAREGIVEKEEGLIALDWIDEAGPLLQRSLATERRVQAARDDLSRTEELIHSITDTQKELESMPDFTAASKLAEKLTQIQQEACEVQRERDSVNGLVNRTNLAQKVLREMPNLEKAQQLGEKIERVLREQSDTKNRINTVKCDLLTYREYQRNILAMKKRIEACEKDLPETCPLCRQPWRKE